MNQLNNIYNIIIIHSNDNKCDIRTLKYEFDIEVNRCLFLIYTLLLMNENDLNYKIYEKEILRIFNKLTIEKKEYIANDLKSIIKIKEKVKVKTYE